MSYFIVISLLLMGYYIAMIVRNPANWLTYLPLLPVILFTGYARMYGMHQHAWIGAFELAGVVAGIVIALLWHQRIVMDHIMLGLNLFLIVGALGFFLHIDSILDWYSTSHGGPLFTIIALVGLVTIFCSSRGFIGVTSKKPGAVKYASFLLLAATFIALVWSVSADFHGLLWAVILPFIALRLIREQLVYHLL